VRVACFTLLVAAFCLALQPRLCVPGANATGLANSVRAAEDKGGATASNVEYKVFSRVVFPQPDGPKIVTNCWSETVREIFLIAKKGSPSVARKHLETFEINSLFDATRFLLFYPPKQGFA
jgi:hypothetical protein